DIAHIGSHAVDAGAYARLQSQMRDGLGDDAVGAVERSADYKIVYDQLNAIRDTEPDLIRYAYLLVPTANPDQARFVVDADVLKGSVNDEPLSHFNQIYDMTKIPLLKRALAECVPEIENDFVYDNDFKVWSVSGYFPLGGTAGHCLGVLGV